MSKSLVIGLSLWLMLGHVYGQGISVPTVRSRSGQFSVRDFSYSAPAQSRPVPVPMADGSTAFTVQSKPGQVASLTRLDPAVLAISCERIKTAVLNELNLPDQWRGRINLTVNGLMPEDSEPALTAACSLDGWNYELAVPATIAPRRLSRWLVNVILLEIANRNATAASAQQIPLWLVDGMVGEIGADRDTMLIQAGEIFIKEETVNQRLEAIRRRLGQTPVLTFEQLSQPGPVEIKNVNNTPYQDSSQLFVHELLRLKDGRASLCRMLFNLPRYTDWQYVFLQAFGFAELRDVEKWWSIASLNASSQATAQWTPNESWHKLNDALDVPVKMQFDPGRPATEAVITLQEVIQQWKPADQTAMLQQKLLLLQSLRLRIAPQYAKILDDYYVTLNTYLHKHPKGLAALFKADASSKRVRNAVCQQLTNLDQQRAGAPSR